MTTDPTRTEPLPDRPLEPPEPGERRVMKWMAVLLATSLFAAGWLAARAESPPGIRNALDTLLQLALGALFLGGAYRLLTYFPYRLLDLLTIVLVLSVGVKVTLEALPGLQYFVDDELLLPGTPAPPLRLEEQLGPLALSCLLTSSVLLGGAALGLRYCTRLKLDRSRQRVAAILYGMLAFPGAVGMFAFPSLLLSELVNSRKSGELIMVYLLFFIASCLITARNGVLLFRSMALEDEVKVKG